MDRPVRTGAPVPPARPIATENPASGIESADSPNRAEPVIDVGILGATRGDFTLVGKFHLTELPDGSRLYEPLERDASFTLPEVRIGIGFHWERTEPQTFRGSMLILPDGTMVNRIPLEEYLRSVISSEMNAAAPTEFLKAHAIVSRSWLVAMLERERKLQEDENPEGAGAGCHTLLRVDPELGCREIVRWYDREAHSRFDVCADDHCQRYQGITRCQSESAGSAVYATRGVVLTFGGEVCDARFSKCCGGSTELFSSAWEDSDVAYLSSVRDYDSEGRCFCGSASRELLDTVLNGYDLDAPDIFRWETSLSQEQARSLILGKIGIDTGAVLGLEPLERGTSGRITRLLVRGARESVIIGKELEIRRVLSPSHLKSSAFDVEVVGSCGGSGIPEAFRLKGRGWGHGVGMCQIGAAVMAAEGYSAEDILKHYFTDTVLTRIYD